MSRVLELYTCCRYVSVVFLFCGCIMASAEREKKTKCSTNMPKGGPPPAACNTSAVLQFLPKGSHAVAGRLNGQPSTSKVVVALLWWHPPRGCHVRRFTTTTITTTIIFRVMSPVSGPESGEERCTDGELVFRRHKENLPHQPGFEHQDRILQGLQRRRGPCAERSQVSRECHLNAAMHYFVELVLFVSLIFVLVLYYALYFLYNSLWCLKLLFIPLYYENIRLCIPRSISGVFIFD